MVVNINTKAVILASVIILMLIFSLIYSLNNIFKDDIKKIFEKEIESLKADQQKIIDNEKLYIIKIDSMRVKLEEMETAKIKIVERHYHTKEIIKQKIEQDEKFIDNLNTHPDTIRKYFTEYKYQPYIRTSN